MINPYPDEPHPNQEWEWKCYWVKKFFKPDQMLTSSCLEWVHQCWVNTKAEWYAKD